MRLPATRMSSVDVKIEVKAINRPGLYPPIPSATSASPSSVVAADTAMRLRRRCAIPLTAARIALMPPTSASAGRIRGDCASTGYTRATRYTPSGATVAAARASTGIADDAAVSLSHSENGNCAARTHAATTKTMPSTSRARGPESATVCRSIAYTPCEMTLNENGSAIDCPEGAVSSDEKTPNLIQVKTTPKVSAMSPAVMTTYARRAWRVLSACCHDSVSNTKSAADPTVHSIKESKRLGLSTNPVVANPSTDEAQKKRRNP